MSGNGSTGWVSCKYTDFLGIEAREVSHFTEQELIELGVVSPEHRCRIRQGAGATLAGPNAGMSSSTFATRTQTGTSD